MQPIRTPLTKAQKQTAERMKLLWLRHKAKTNETQVQIAQALGITQGSFTQYMNAHIAMNTDFLLKFCHHIGADPAEADPSLANVLLANAKRVPIKYDWDRELPDAGPISNILIESEDDLFGVLVPAEKTLLGHAVVAVVKKNPTAATRARAIGYLKVRTRGEWEIMGECKGDNCWAILAVVAPK